VTSATDVTIVVPLAGSCPHRERAWAYAHARWETEHPTWPIVIGACPDPWRKAVAVRDGIQRAATPIVIVADADVWTPGIADAVELVRRERTWAQPHRRFLRLTESATARVLDGVTLLEDAMLDPLAHLERPYVQVLGGGVTILRRDAALAALPDPRFVGWGGQDIAWGLALQTLAGKPARGRLTTVHLWHPPQERVARNTGSPENMRLLRRYRAVAHKPEAMRALVREGQEATA
jgi:hypothetical protein